ncbi:hypothetical protein A3195_11570 [Candidatus Thiodiazotropha endoloripes]|uniref:Uncharacterized protein n=1 Tax=Candidatus Thiodiazotropha endoloripes TaxID=1818881 RepID=A0A1E2US54_9GAMM|nr:hypothetical protein A3195_11570 [Candidatus Thiodiazotropha endoloripes]ODB88298.1 hypothetical protein A3193_05375 [Candidatus Thiodiazotropha endoloripes]ODB89746.1 hypothetical protein A3194_11435 [Candidatus Thiodiazotropha endoloripes]ODB97385.1 hypothetical protein A3196_11815 [Candidatus Thiodiazotropha endoloripes]
MSSGPAQHPRFFLRAIMALGSLVLGIYFAQLSLFNAWQTAFEQLEPHYQWFEIQFWLYAMLSAVCIGFFIWLTRDTIKHLNSINTKN